MKTPPRDRRAAGAGKRTFPSVEPPARSELWFHSALSNLFSPRWSDRVPAVLDRFLPVVEDLCDLHGILDHC